MNDKIEPVVWVATQILCAQLNSATVWPNQSTVARCVELAAELLRQCESIEDGE